MASGSYFEYFNVINYGNNKVVDITQRSIVTPSYKDDPDLYYPVDISAGARADIVSYNNFKNPYYSWILYLDNDIIDPYYGWYLTDEEFDAFIQTKYGSLEAAMNKVMFYRSNWVEQPNIAVADYEALTANQQTFWQPNYDFSRVLSYSRSNTDIFASTNFILNIGISTPGSFIENEIVNISYTPTSNGSGQVVTSNSTNVIIQHIFDDAFPHDSITINSGSYIYGTESNSNCIITSCNFLSNNISADTIAYYEPVYYYDYEKEKNEGNKIVRVLNPNNVPNFISSFKKLMSNNFNG
jgi:hypothetical protein